MRWGENAGGGDDAISTSSRSKEQESADQQGSDGRERDGLVRPGQAEVISMTSGYE